MKANAPITYVGIDMAKSKFDICIYDGDFSNCIYETYSNNDDGFSKLLSYFNSINHLVDFRIGVEATSTYMIELQKFLDGEKIRYILINPKRIKYYKRYKNFENKTDKLDSYYIADYITTLKDNLFNSNYDHTKYTYKAYQAYINSLTKYQTQQKGLGDSILSDSFVSPSLRNNIIKANETIDKVRSESIIEFTKLIKIAMPEFDLIKADIVGVSDMTLLAVLPLIYDVVDTYSKKQLQSYIGLNIIYNDSGSSVNKKQRVSKNGSELARKQLYMSAVSAVQHNSIVKEKYHRFRDNNKPHQVAMVACSAHLFRAIVSKLKYYKGLNKDV
ncbi:transposase [Sulfurimonas sp.]|uniref:IS110 family transposase n=1 Tax=Sulfurimonas sp. TaxID=2022749 RepID=UPI00356382FA